MKHFNDFIRAFAYCRTMWAANLTFHLLRWFASVDAGEFDIAWVCLAIAAVDIFGLWMAISYWRKQ